MFSVIKSFYLCLPFINYLATFECILYIVYMYVFKERGTHPSGIIKKEQHTKQTDKQTNKTQKNKQMKENKQTH